MSGHSFTFQALHLVWSTKERIPMIDADWAPRLHQYAGGICRDMRCTLLAAGHMPDHVHYLIRLHQSVALDDILRVVKSKTTGWLKAQVSVERRFAWQRGYGAFSISEDRVERVKSYIRNQDKHHRVKTFQEEFIEFLERHHIDYDPRDIWR